MRLIPFNESLYSDLAFDYNKTLKSYIAKTGREIISITPGFGPFDGYFKITIEDDAGILFSCSELSLDGQGLNEDILDKVTSIISATYSDFAEINSIADLYYIENRFETELSKRLRDAF